MKYSASIAINNFDDILNGIALWQGVWIFFSLAWQSKPKEGENEMKVLICISNSPAQRYMVTLTTKALVKEVVGLISKNKRSQAVMKALSKGRFEREIAEDEANSVEADVILSETNVRWSVKK